jgi:hypothetical protein
MKSLDDISHPPDICLLLRSHSEQHWLSTHLMPVIADLESPGAIPEDQLGAALAYLEILWLDARRRASETDSALAQLADVRREHSDLGESARAYHAAVSCLRNELHASVGGLLRSHAHGEAHQHASS